MDFPTPLIVQSAEAAFPKAQLYIPHVSGGKQAAADAKMNKVLLQGSQHLVDSQGPLTDPRAEMLALYELKTNEKEVLSISLVNYAYTGGAHGATLVKSYSFDSSTGEVSELKDLFKPGADYITPISKHIKAALESRGITTFEPFKSIKPNQDFYIADRSLVIYFQQYEIAPYSYGLLYFPISIYDLQNIINDKGLLAKLF